MPAYRYTAIDAAGRSVRGRSEHPTQSAAAHALRERGLFVLAIEATEERSNANKGAARAALVLAFTRTIATLLGAGLPLSRALAAAQHTARRSFGETVRVVRTRVDRGDSLAEALTEHACFSPLYVGMVRAGERSGDLPGAFGRLAEHLEKEAEFRARLLSASLYPLVLTVAGSAAILVLLLFVLPRFAVMLEGAGAELPRSTAVVLAGGELFRVLWPAIPAIAIAALLALASIQASPAARRSAAALLLRIPVLGPLRRDAITARFARLLAILLGGGAAFMSALRDASLSIADPIARGEIERLQEQVREGRAFHASLTGSAFSPILIDLAAIGEESGRLAELLLKTAEILDREVERAVQHATTLAEPLLIVSFGTVLGFIALALLQAVYGVNAGSFR